MSIQSPDQLDGFETRLLVALRTDIGTRADAGQRAGTPVRHRPRARWSFAAAGGVAAAAVAGVLVLQPGPAAAYAVDEQPGGDVVVTIHRLDDAAGLERALADKGVDAVVEYKSQPDLPPAGADGAQAGRGTLGEGGAAGEAHSAGTGNPAIVGSGPSLDATGGQDAACSISVGLSQAGVTFRLPASTVDSDAILHITTAGSLDGPSGVGVQWQGDGC
jgi:hypothetical protein